MKVFKVLGVNICAVSMRDAFESISGRIKSGAGGYVCFCNVHTTVMAARSTSYREVLNGAFLALPDGKPIYWVGKSRGIEGVHHLPGPDFMLASLNQKNEVPLRHYFLGGKREVLEALISRIKKQFKQVDIVGRESPPFRPLTSQEIDDMVHRINNARPDIIWVGLGAPKQEVFMNDLATKLAPAILFGVGAAFDFHAGSTKRAPAWMRTIGMEWLFRLLNEPRRLFFRYMVTNTLFVWLLLREKIRVPANIKGNSN